MKKYFAAILMLGLLVSASATVASAAQSASDQSAYSSPGGNG